EIEPTARIGKKLDRVDRQNTLRPQRSLETRILSALRGQLAGCLDRMERNRLHAEIGKGDRCIRGNRDALELQRFLKAHQAKSDRSVTQVGAPRLRYRVEIDVDDVVEHPHCGGDRALQLG